MASTAEIKNRIRSVKDTQKITNAMYLIASTKMRKAKNELDLTRPHFNALKGEIKRIFRTAKDVNSRYFYPEDGSHMENETYGCLVITADKGLAGSYNQNVIKEAQSFLNKHEDTKLFVVGEYGRQYFRQHNIPIEKSFLYTAQNPTLDRARDISTILLDFYCEEKVKKIFIFYTDMKNNMKAEVAIDRLLPLHRQIFEDTLEKEKPVEHSFEFLPSADVILDSVIPSYLTSYIYSALVDSFCSEQNERMVAMNSANQNAESILEELSIEYNRLRQSIITQEITEVSSGAKAQKRKHKKKVGVK